MVQPPISSSTKLVPAGSRGKPFSGIFPYSSLKRPRWATFSAHNWVLNITAVVCCSQATVQHECLRPIALAEVISDYLPKDTLGQCFPFLVMKPCQLSIQHQSATLQADSVAFMRGSIPPMALNGKQAVAELQSFPCSHDSHVTMLANSSHPYFVLTGQLYRLNHNKIRGEVIKEMDAEAHSGQPVPP